MNAEEQDARVGKPSRSLISHQNISELGLTVREKVVPFFIFEHDIVEENVRHGC